MSPAEFLASEPAYTRALECEVERLVESEWKAWTELLLALGKMIAMGRAR